MKISIDIPIYNIPLKLCDSFDEQDNPESPHQKTTLGQVWNDETGIYFTFRRTKQFGGGALAHECLHIAHRVFRITGVNADIWNDEHTAYLITWIYRAIFDFVFLTGEYKKTKKNNKGA